MGFRLATRNCFKFSTSRLVIPDTLWITWHLTEMSMKEQVVVLSTVYYFSRILSGTTCPWIGTLSKFHGHKRNLVKVHSGASIKLLNPNWWSKLSGAGGNEECPALGLPSFHPGDYWFGISIHTAWSKYSQKVKNHYLSKGTPPKPGKLERGYVGDWMENNWISNSNSIKGEGKVWNRQKLETKVEFEFSTGSCKNKCLNAQVHMYIICSPWQS